MAANRPLVGALVLLVCLATGAYATSSRPSFWKHRCYVPGCTSCETYNPYKCLDCDTANGYVKLSNGVCGCAAGYGSYAIPPKTGFPMYAPFCPAFMGLQGSGGADKTASTLKPYTKPLQPQTYYHDRPKYCHRGYFADGICQYPPGTGQGFCQCLKCPTGYSSYGGLPIVYSTCMPVPRNNGTGGGGNGTSGGGGGGSPQPVVRCKGRPPVAGNANNWNRKCANLKVGKKCGTGVTCKAPFIPDPTVGGPMAYCEKGGVWVVKGACVAPAGTPDCPNTPAVGANATAWGATCRNGNIGDVCSAPCREGFSGTAVATCTERGWSVTSICEANPPDNVQCPGVPPTGDNAEDFTCNGGDLDEECTANCLDGFSGLGAIAVCTSTGWDVVSDCTEDNGGGDGVVCPGPPPPAEGADPWDENADECFDGALDDYCEGTCTDYEFGVVEAFCTPDGWQVDNGCDPVDY